LEIEFLAELYWLLYKLLNPMPYSVKKLVYDIWCKTTEAGKVADKGERFVVSNWREMINCGEFYHLYHAFRYWWAGQQIIPKSTRLLDLGCGSGYGTDYLQSIHNLVVGYDPEEKAINWAKKHFKGDFRVNKNWEKYGLKFDVICCFETIEHDPDDVLSIILNCLSKDGLLLISTANGSKNSVRQRLINNKLVTVNPGHKKEFTSEEFEKLLKQHFRNVKLYGQCIKGVNDFELWSKWRRKSTVRLTDFEMREKDFINCEVIVAVCRK